VFTASILIGSVESGRGAKGFGAGIAMFCGWLLSRFLRPLFFFGWSESDKELVDDADEGGEGCVYGSIRGGKAEFKGRRKGKTERGSCCN
jgi:hypothetical protein